VRLRCWTGEFSWGDIFFSLIGVEAVTHNGPALITVAIFGLGGQIFYGKEIIGSGKKVS
jgi:hypothetical protein